MRFAPKLAPDVKLVVDTNTLVSGTLWSGPPARLLNAIFAVPGTLCLSTAIVIELGNVLVRSKFAGRLTALGITVSDIMLRFQRLSRRALAADIALPPDLRDPKDLKILAAAVGAKADAIVTGDDDLLVLKNFEGIPIVKVQTMLEMLGLPAE
jgi:putative PIN family toxin of toxin-antitoxin system